MSWYRRLGVVLLTLCAVLVRHCHGKRVVVFVGPKQSGSGEIHELFTKYCTGLKYYAKKKAFQGWRWPLMDDAGKDKRLRPGRFLSLLGSRAKSDGPLIPLVTAAIKQTFSDHENIIFGSDELGHFGESPYSKRNGIKVLQNLATTLNHPALEVVVNYRAPRRRHWFMIWEQSSKLSYSEWICSDEYDRIWESLDSTANPLGLVDALLTGLSRKASVKLIDLEGVKERNLQLSHVAACSVMNISCHLNSTMIKGVNAVTAFFESTPRPTDGVSKRQIGEIEWVLRQRDCLYQGSLQQHNRLEVIEPFALWQDCNSTDLIPELSNTTYLLELLRSQFQCAQDPTISLARLGQEHKAIKPNRVVVFAGPHKSASSTVQEFLIQYCTGRALYKQHRAFDDWRWPSVESASKVPDRKILSRLVYNETKDAKLIASISSAIAKTYHEYANLVLGSEELDRFGTVPWSGRDGIKVVQDIEKLLNHQALEIVVNYRTPRQKQWLSIWKQLTAMDVLEGKPDSTYSKWICTDHVRSWEFLDCVANPLGLAEAMLSSLSQLATVKLIDMGGVAKQKLDISHVSACSILNVPCNNTWVNGIGDRALIMNAKSKSKKDISPEVSNEMRWVLEQRDCLYQASLEEHSNFEVLYQDSLWGGCDPAALISELSNTTFILDLLRSQFGCAHDPTVNLTQFIKAHDAGRSRGGDQRATKTIKATATPITTNAFEHSATSAEKFGTGQAVKSFRAMNDFQESVTKRLDQHPEDWRLVQGIQWILVLVLFASFLVRKQRRRRES